MAIKYECRSCKKVTNQIERIVVNNLPPNVKVLECCLCSKLSVCMMEDDEMDCD
jgi:hypothetical protein